MENLSSSSSSSSSSSVFVSTSRSNDHHHKLLDNLPDLVYYHILKNLDLDDLWSLRLINKRFYSIVKDFKIIQLHFLDFSEYYVNLGNWFSTTKPTRIEYRLDISKLPLLSNPSNNLLNLKYLKIQHSDDSFKLDDLNKFTKLQILETDWSSKRFKNHLLQLPDLRALSIQRDFYEDSTGNLVVDTPNLHSLSITNDNGNGIKFNHLQSIRYYRTNQYDKNMTVRFINLECLEFSYDLPINFKADDLLEFKNLRRLRLNNCTHGRNAALKDLFRSKKDNLELVIEGVKIKEINKIDEYGMNGLKFQLDNYGELEDDLTFITYITYDDLVDLLPDNQPSDLFDKYTNIQQIAIYSRIKDVDRLIHFIKSCPNLNRLYSCLDQQFYDRLPVINSLSNLQIINEEDLNLDYELIMKMPYLRRFETNGDVLISEQLNLNHFKRLYCFSFKINNREVRIIKKSKDGYKVDHKTINHDKLVKWTNLLRKKRQIETRSMSRKRKLSY